MCSSILSLSKIAHQMWRDQPPTQPKKQDYRKNSWGRGWRWQGIGGEGVAQNLKKEGVSNIGGLEALCQLCKETKSFPFPHYKTTPPPLFLTSPTFLINIFHPPIRAIFENLTPPHFMKGIEGVRTMTMWLCYIHKKLQLQFHNANNHQT